MWYAIYNIGNLRSNNQMYLELFKKASRNLSPNSQIDLELDKRNVWKNKAQRTNQIYKYMKLYTIEMYLKRNCQQSNIFKTISKMC